MESAGKQGCRHHDRQFRRNFARGVIWGAVPAKSAIMTPTALPTRSYCNQP